MQHTLILLALLLMAAACNSGSGSREQADSTRTGATGTATAPATGSAHTASPVGSYQGTLPCADCPGIDCQVSLYDDHHYKILMVYKDRNNGRAFVETGSWKQEDSIIILEQQPLTMQQRRPGKFQLADGKLYQLDQDGQRITGALADNYVLRPIEGGGNRALLKEKAKAGASFWAVGNEPGWTLELTRKRALTFINMNGDTIKLNLQAPRPSSDSLKVYSGKTAAGPLTLSILQRACNDDMTGFMRAYTVEVKVKDQTYRGCGEYLDDEEIRQ